MSFCHSLPYAVRLTGVSDGRSCCSHAVPSTDARATAVSVPWPRMPPCGAAAPCSDAVPDVGNLRFRLRPLNLCPRQVMVFSTVRANPSASLGFLDDWRRLNVAITRPRRALLLVGNADTLRRSGGGAAPAPTVAPTGSGFRSGFAGVPGSGFGSGSGSVSAPMAGPALGSGGHWSAYMSWLEGLPGGVVVRGGAAGLGRLGWRLGG